MIKVNHVPIDVTADRTDIISDEYPVNGLELNKRCNNCLIKSYIIDVIKKWNEQKYTESLWLLKHNDEIVDGSKLLMEVQIKLITKQAEVFDYLNKDENCSCESR